MKRSTFTRLLTLGILSISVITVLILTSTRLKLQRNSFLRVFPPHPVLEGDTLVLAGDGYYIAGSTAHTLYLSNRYSPLHLVEVNLHTLDTAHIRLSIKDIYEQKFWSPRVTVDSPHYYLYDGAVPVIYGGSTANWAGDILRRDSIYFMDLVPLSDSIFVVRSLSGQTGENVLGELLPRAPHYFFTDQILEKQHDGVFCTDGTMLYDAHSKQIIYVYYFRNEFMVMDSALNLIARGHTLDTITRARIKTALLSNGTRMLAAPPQYVNLRSQVSNDRLFVHSNLLARNEPENSFKQAAVIDVYTVSSREYKFSFYLFDYYPNKKLTDFRVVRNHLVALYGDRLQLFTLERRFFTSRSP